MIPRSRVGLQRRCCRLLQECCCRHKGASTVFLLCVRVSHVSYICFLFLSTVLCSSAFLEVDFWTKMVNLEPLCPGFAPCEFQNRDDPHVLGFFICCPKSPIGSTCISEQLYHWARLQPSPQCGPHLWARLNCYLRVDGPLSAVHPSLE